MYVCQTREGRRTWKSPLEAGEARRASTLVPPLDWPMIVTRAGSPPKARTCSCFMCGSWSMDVSVAVAKRSHMYVRLTDLHPLQRRLLIQQAVVPARPPPPQALRLLAQVLKGQEPVHPCIYCSSDG